MDADFDRSSLGFRRRAEIEQTILRLLLFAQPATRGFCMPRLMTIAQFQQEFGLSRSTVYRLFERRVLCPTRVGRSVRIDRDDAERWYKSLRDEHANDG